MTLRTHLQQFCWRLGSLLFLALLAAGCGPAKKIAVVSVHTEPVKARIYLDGKFVAESPCRVEIPDTAPADLWEVHTVEARTRGHAPTKRVFRYRTGAPWIPKAVTLTLPSDPNAFVVDRTAAPTMTTWQPSRPAPPLVETPPVEPAAALSVPAWTSPRLSTAREEAMVSPRNGSPQIAPGSPTLVGPRLPAQGASSPSDRPAAGTRILAPESALTHVTPSPMSQPFDSAQTQPMTQTVAVQPPTLLPVTSGASSPLVIRSPDGVARTPLPARDVPLATAHLTKSDMPDAANPQPTRRSFHSDRPAAGPRILAPESPLTRGTPSPEAQPFDNTSAMTQTVAVQSTTLLPVTSGASSPLVIRSPDGVPRPPLPARDAPLATAHLTKSDIPGVAKPKSGRRPGRSPWGTVRPEMDRPASSPPAADALPLSGPTLVTLPRLSVDLHPAGSNPADSRLASAAGDSGYSRVLTPERPRRAAPKPTPPPLRRSAPPSAPLTRATPADSRRLVCEFRVVRIADQSVVGQVSGMEFFTDRNDLATDLTALLAARIPAQSRLAVVSLCNRRHTEQGRLVSDELTTTVAKVLRNTKRFRVVRQIDLREAFVTEWHLEHARRVTAASIRPRLGNAQYVIIGGVALSETLPNDSPKED